MQQQLFALTVSRPQIERVVSQINSKKFRLTQVEQLPHDLFIFAYEGTELLYLTKQEDLDPLPESLTQ